MPINTLLKGYLKDFKGFTNKETELINEKSYFKSMKKESTMIGCGSVCSEVYFLIRGKIRVYKILPDGKEITLYRIQDGEMCLFTISQILDHEPFDAIATVEQDSEVLVMPDKVFLNLLDSNSNFRNYIFKRLIDSLSEVMLLVEELTFKNMNKRVAKFILDVLPNNTKQSFDNCILRTTHEKIASELGTAREVVSRLLKEFESQGIIKLSRGRIEILDIDMLKNISIM